MKTNETCQECGGTGKLSKALYNTLVSFNDFGNDANQRGTTQANVGPPALVDCMKCTNCGHSWWHPSHKINDPEQKHSIGTIVLNEFVVVLNTNKIHRVIIPDPKKGLTMSIVDLVKDGFTDDFIDEHFVKVNPRYFRYMGNSVVNNKKQFKNFNQELFTKYINKFSSKDKLHAINTLIVNLAEDKEYDFKFATEIVKDALETHKR